MVDIIINVMLIALILIIAIVLLLGKGSFLIAGYNMLPKEKKEKVDTVRFCRFMGKIVLSICCSSVLLLASQVTGVEAFNIIALIILALSVIIALVWSHIYYLAPARK